MESDWCPNKKIFGRTKRHGDAHTQKRDHVRAQGEDGHVQAEEKEKGVGRNQSADT